VLIEVLPGTPAEESGLRTGDRIISVNGVPIRSAHDLTDRLDRILAHTTIQLGVIRGHASRREKIFVSLRTASRPSQRQVAQVEPTTAGPPLSSLGTSAPASTSAVASAPAAAPPAATVPSLAQPGAPAKPASLWKASLSENVPPTDRATPSAPGLRPNDLQLTLPRAVVERLEQLERRLEKLESPSGGAAKALSAKRDPQIGSVRNP